MAQRDEEPVYGYWSAVLRDGSVWRLLVYSKLTEEQARKQLLREMRGCAKSFKRQHMLVAAQDYEKGIARWQQDGALVRFETPEQRDEAALADRR